MADSAAWGQQSPRKRSWLPRDRHVQRIVGPVQVWVGLSVRSFYVGFSVMPHAGATLGLAVVHIGIARKPRGLL